MKRIVFTVIAALFSIIASSQEHMKFKGFDIDGSTEEFANKLTTVGFTIINTNEKQIYGLKGEFAGYEATVVAYPNSKGITYGIAVLYDLKDTAWKKRHLHLYAQHLQENEAAILQHVINIVQMCRLF